MDATEAYRLLAPHVSFELSERVLLQDNIDGANKALLAMREAITNNQSLTVLEQWSEMAKRMMTVQAVLEVKTKIAALAAGMEP